MGRVFGDSETTTAVLTAEPPSGISERGAINWKALRDCAQQVDAENIRLRARVQTLEARDASTDEPDCEPPASWSDNAKYHWNKIKARAQAAEQRAADLENTVNQLRSVKPKPDENLTTELEAYDQAFERAAQKAARELSVFRLAPGDTRWNALVQQRQREAREFFLGQIDMDAAATYAFFAIAFKSMVAKR